MRKNSRSTQRLALTIAAATVAAGLTSRVHAQTVVTWLGGASDYNVGFNWSSGTAPSNAANEYLMINNGGTAQVSANSEGAFLHLGYAAGNTGSLEVTAGTLTLGELRVGGREQIPDPANPGQFLPNGGGTGSVVQSGSSVVNVTYSTGTEPPVQSLYIGDSGLSSGNTARGSYTIRDSAVLNNGINTSDEIVIGTGPGARGTFVQEGASTVNSTGKLIVGRRGATASYSLSGTGTLAPISNLYVGDADTVDGATAGTVGVFNQSGGTVSTKATMEIGRKGGTGTYSISAGNLALGAQLNIGSAGTSGSPALPLTGQQNSVGTLNISGTANVTTTNLFNVFVGFNNAQTTFQSAITSSAFFNMTGGTMTLSNTLFMIGSGSGTTGTATLTAGTLQPAINPAATPPAPYVVEIDVGRSAGSGTLNVSGTASITAGSILVGGNTGTVIGNSGTLNVSGNANVSLSGALTLSGSPLAGTTPTRTINIDGGTVTVATLGATTTAAGAITRNFNMTAGALSVSGNFTGGNAVTWNFSGGNANLAGTANTLTSSTLNISNSANVTLNSLSTATGTLFVSGGTIAWPANISLGSGSTVRTSVATSIPSIVALGNVTLQSDTGGAMTLTGAVTSPTTGRTITKTGPGSLTLAGPWSYTVSGTAPVNNPAIVTNDGTTNINVDLNGFNSTVGMAITAAPAGAVNFNSNQHVKSVTASGTITLSAGGSKTLTIDSLSIPNGGTLNLTNNSMSVTSANLPAPTLRGLLSSAYAGGSWTGTGLTSTTARDRADHATGLGYSDDGATTTVKYTWGGDLNLDGVMNGDDFALIDRQVAKNGLGSAGAWVNGDVNFDGSVTTADYIRMDSSYFYANGGTLSPEFLAQREAQFGRAYVAALTAAVPEPTLLATGYWLLATSLLTRRRTAR